MALLFSCGMDSSRWDEAALIDLFDFYGTGNAPSSGGPFNTGFLSVAHNNGIGIDLPQRTTVRWGMWMSWPEKTTTTADSHRLALWSDYGKTGTRMCAFFYGDQGDTGHMYEWGVVDHDSTVVWSGFVDDMSPAGPYEWYEFEVTISATVGTMKMWRAGVQILNATGLNTAGSFTSGPKHWSMADSGSHSARRIYVDDLVIWDANGSVMSSSPLGAVRIHTTGVDGDGSTTNWTPSSGTARYAMVDEGIADEDTTYNESTTTNDRDELDFAAPAQGSGILGVSVHVQAKRVDAGTGTMTVGLKQSTSESSTSTSLGDAAGYTYCSHATSVDPNTGSQWTDSGLASAQVFYENGG